MRRAHILRDDETRIIIKKTSLCWLLRSDCQKLSSDRLMRVRNTTHKQQADCKSKKGSNKIKFHQQKFNMNKRNTFT